ncbi:MAG: TrmB family transcriptional regulator [Gemmatimonadales bacterium]
MSTVDLTPFGFTPTESRVYEVLLTAGPGTGYAIAQQAGLARANAYSALEGLVSKGAALVQDGRPKRYRPEPPATLMARISNRQGIALERLDRELDALAVPSTPTVVEIESPRGVLQLLSHEIARATESVALLAPAEAYPLLSPVLRRAVAASLVVELCAELPVSLPFAPVAVVSGRDGWPGLPLISIVDNRNAVLAARIGSEVRGHWSTAPTFVAAARIALDSLRAHP